MHASFSFHQSNLQLAYTTQACILNLNFSNACNHMWMHIQMHHTSSWACYPYLCAQILIFNLIDPLPLSYLSPHPMSIFSPYICAKSLDWKLAHMYRFELWESNVYQMMLRYKRWIFEAWYQLDCTKYTILSTISN